VPVDEVTRTSGRPWGPSWLQAVITAIGASFGGWAGALMLRRVNEKKLAAMALGVAFTIGLFWTAP
jgi:uncharacterized membrane protein YfcA